MIGIQGLILRWLGRVGTTPAPPVLIPDIIICRSMIVDRQIAPINTILANQETEIPLLPDITIDFNTTYLIADTFFNPLIISMEIAPMVIKCQQ